MNLYVVFINPLRYESNNKLTQVECHYFTDMTEASEFAEENGGVEVYSRVYWNCLLYTSPSPRDLSTSRMPSSA